MPPRFPIPVLAFAVALACALPTLRAQNAPTTSPASTQPAPFKPTLMALGTPGRVWIAYVEPYREGARTLYKTAIRTQGLPADPWEELPTLYGHAVALASLQGELAVLLDDGNWKRLGESISSGPSVTAGTGPVLAWASSPHSLYAIRAVEGGVPALTSPAPSTTAPTTQIASRPATSPTPRDVGPGITTRPVFSPPSTRSASKPPVPVLFRYYRGEWAPQADLPSAASGRELALTVLNHRPVLAAETSPGILHTWVLGDTGWFDWGQVKASPATGRFSLLSTTTSTGLWTIDPDGGMQLFLRSENEPWALAKGFTVPSAVPPNAQRALTVAGQELRLVLLKDAKLWEQRYDLAGNLRGPLAELPPARSQQPTPFLWIIQSVVLLVMVLVMLVTLYRRRSAQSPSERDSEE